VNQGGGGLHNGACFSGNQVYILNNTSANQGGGFFNDSNCGDSNTVDPLVYVPGPLITLNNFMISNNTSKFGGGYNHDLGMGPVSLSNGVISGNTAECCYTNKGTTYQTGGGGLYNQGGTYTITNVIFAGNKATSPGGYGGGIVNVWGNMTLKNVTVYGSAAAYGAGIYNGGQELLNLIPPLWAVPHNKLVAINLTLSTNLGVSSGPTPSDPTIPVNQATGGGVYNTTNGQFQMINSTIAANTSRFGGGINNDPNGTNNVVSLTNSILAFNQSILYPIDDPGMYTPECRGMVQSQGYNILLGNPDPTKCNFVSISTDKINTDPQLLPLGAYGGFVLTHAFVPSSPALDAGNSDPTVCPSVDARSIRRPMVGKKGDAAVCDIGAFEFAQYKVYFPTLTK
jgi:hypothetical protein